MTIIDITVQSPFEILCGGVYIEFPVFERPRKVPEFTSNLGHSLRGASRPINIQKASSRRWYWVCFIVLVEVLGKYVHIVTKQVSIEFQIGGIVCPAGIQAIEPFESLVAIIPPWDASKFFPPPFPRPDKSCGVISVNSKRVSLSPVMDGMEVQTSIVPLVISISTFGMVLRRPSTSWTCFSLLFLKNHHVI